MIFSSLDPIRRNPIRRCNDVLVICSALITFSIILFHIYDRFSVITYILSLSRDRMYLPLAKRLSALSGSLKARFMTANRRSVYEAVHGGICISIDREDVLCSAVRKLGRRLFPSFLVVLALFCVILFCCR